MTEPSEAALRKACEVLEYDEDDVIHLVSIRFRIEMLARHFDAEDKAARSAVAAQSTLGYEYFTKRHILPDPKPTVRDVVEAWRDTPGRTTEALATMLRDAGLLREDG